MTAKKLYKPVRRSKRTGTFFKSIDDDQDVLRDQATLIDDLWQAGE